jgi:hypothetical protein
MGPPADIAILGLARPGQGGLYGDRLRACGLEVIDELVEQLLRPSQLVTQRATQAQVLS